MMFFDLLSFFQDAAGTETHSFGIFLLACGVMGLLTIALDAAHMIVRSRSLLGINHSPVNTSIILLAWVVGAIIGGFFGSILHILQPTPLAALTAGIGWPYILTKAAEQAAKQVPGEPEPYQQPTIEEGS